MSAHPEWEQHWVAPQAARRALMGLSLTGLSVVEFGAGTGELTRALLEVGVATVQAWEIDPDLPPLQDARVEWVARDIAFAREADLRGKALISFPPYSTLDFICALVERSEPLGAVLMAPDKKLPELFALGYRAILALESDDFNPPSRGSHWVVAKGF